MCGGGGNYGEVAQGIGGMFGSGQAAPGMQGPAPATAPTPSGDTMSGIGSYMPMQQAAQAYAPTANFDPSQIYAAEAMYDPMAAAQARLDTIPQTQARSVADLTPKAVAATQQPSQDGLTRAQAEDIYNMLGYKAVPQYRMASLSLAPPDYRQVQGENGLPSYLIDPVTYRSAVRSSRGR